MSVIQLPLNKLQQVQPTVLFDETFALGVGLLKQYTMTGLGTFISISITNQFAATLVVAGQTGGGNVVTYYNGALAANTLYHLEIGPAALITQITITNVDVAIGNIAIIQECLGAA
jgi:hypothetical protein